VKTVVLPKFDINNLASERKTAPKLGIKVNSNRNEAYLRYRYPPLTIGPYLFVGQIKAINSKWLLHIRIGPLTAIFILFLVVYSLFSFDFKDDLLVQITNILLLIIVIGFFYISLWNPSKRILNIK